MHQPQPAQQLLQFRRVGGDADLVAALQHKITVGDIHLVTALYHTHQHMSFVFFAQFVQPQTAQHRVVFQPQLDHLEIAARKGFDLNRRREFQDVEQLLRRQKFRIDGHRQPQLLAHKAERTIVVFGVADARDGMGSAHFFRHKAAQHIQLIRAGHRHKQLGFLHSGFAQCFAIRAVAAHTDHIIDVGDSVQHSGVSIDRCDIVPLCYQTVDNGRADLAASGHQNIHKMQSSSFFTNLLPV